MTVRGWQVQYWDGLGWSPLATENWKAHQVDAEARRVSARSSGADARIIRHTCDGCGDCESFRPPALKRDPRVDPRKGDVVERIGARGVLDRIVFSTWGLGAVPLGAPATDVKVTYWSTAFALGITSRTCTLRQWRVWAKRAKVVRAMTRKPSSRG